MTTALRAAFYDFDGTLASSNVVTRYAFFAKHHPSKAEAIVRYTKLLALVPYWIGLDLYSRRLFNEVFFRQYRGMPKDWLYSEADRLFEHDVRPKIFSGAARLLEKDRAEGFRLVLVSGGMDFDLGPVVRHFGFDDVISNQLVFENGAATGEVVSPLLAEREKVAAIEQYCRRYNVNTAQSKGYSDSFSDVPMLEAIGLPTAVNPDRRLRKVARERAWPVLDLRSGPEPREE
jgi:HAD superfamily hydrolase (TIGR01490 family)